MAGLKFSRHFTTENQNVMESVKWKKVDAVIKSPDGKIVFEQKGVEFPEQWTQQAINITSEKYFRGELGTVGRECSLRQLVSRLVYTMTNWGIEQGYFDTKVATIFQDELTWLVLNQRIAWNSPVWFNLGFGEKPATSACFIQSVDDSIEGIMDLARRETMLFKYGSGTGTNFSSLRSSREPVKGGGKASGPISFMRGLDGMAGAIRSGGRIRRSAKLACLDVDHPDIMEFIQCKVEEERKARALMDAGWRGEMGGGAYESVGFQNTNNSVRVSDDFMQAVLNNEDWETKFVKSGEMCEKIPARKIFRAIAEAAYFCGDPGVQFDTTINEWNTLAVSGKIRASNPCLSGKSLLMTSRGLCPIEELCDREVEIVNGEGRFSLSKIFYTGMKDVVKVTLSSGHVLEVTPDHRIKTPSGGYVRADSINSKVYLSFPGNVEWKGNILDVSVAELIGFATGDGTPKRVQGNSNTSHSARIYLRADGDDIEIEQLFYRTFKDAYRPKDVKLSAASKDFSNIFEKYRGGGFYVWEREASDFFVRSDTNTMAAFLRGYFSANGSVLEKYRRIQIKTTSKKLMEQLIKMLSMFGIRSYCSVNRPKLQEFINGSYMMKESYNLNISTDGIKIFSKRIGFLQKSKSEKLGRLIKRIGSLNQPRINWPVIKKVEYIGIKPVYDFTEPLTHSGGVDGIVVHNCSEHMSLDNTACNLASINLLKYKKHDGVFDVAGFKHTVRLLITSQDILINRSGFPTPQIEENAQSYRQLGLGYANLGSLLMAYGFPYDSVPGRNLAASITSLMTATAYWQSAVMADVLGPFKWFKKNRRPFMKVIRKHIQESSRLMAQMAANLPTPRFKDIGDLVLEADKAWHDAEVKLLQEGARNSQMSCLAPTGCIVPGTFVSTEEGLVKIGSLGNIYGEQWQDIDKWVASDCGPKKATKFYVNGKKETKKIITELGLCLEATLNHRIRVINKEGYVWKFVGDIKKGDVVVLLRDTNITISDSIIERSDYIERSKHIGGSRPTEVIFNSNRITEEMAYFLGYYMGNGNTKNDRVIRLSIGKKRYENQREMLEKCIKLAFGIEKFGNIEFKTGAYGCSIHSKDLVEFLRYNKMLKEKSPTAFIPEVVLKSSRKILSSFIKGLFDSDGSVSKTGISISLTSECLIDDLQFALLSLGIVSIKYIYKDRRGSIGKRILYKLSIGRVEEYRRFRNSIGFRDKDRIDILNVICNKKRDKGVKKDWYWKVLSELFNIIWKKRNNQRIFLENKISELLPCNSVLTYVKDTVLGFSATVDLSVPDGNSYQAGGFISHNTIGFIMDCATTGIEPEMSLVKFKKLVGGGEIKIVNTTIRQALSGVGYSAGDMDSIEKYIYEKGMVEGCPLVKQEHLAIFDCALRPVGGTRSISPSGHIDMMAAVQPFLSAAISKTINCSSDATVEEVEKIYMESWEKGLKSVTIYRDGSKILQPLNQKGSSQARVKPKREHLPEERKAICHKFSVAGNEGYVHVGEYEDGRPGEVFIRMAKEGSTVAGIMDSLATSISIGLQHGIEIQSYISKFKHMRFEPSGFTTNEHIKIAQSIVDYLARWLELKFSNQVDDKKKEEVDSMVIGPVCPECGNMTIRKGTCFTCSVCGSSTGCSG